MGTSGGKHPLTTNNLADQYNMERNYEEPTTVRWEKYCLSEGLGRIGHFFYPITPSYTAKEMSLSRLKHH